MQAHQKTKSRRIASPKHRPVAVRKKNGQEQNGSQQAGGPAASVAGLGLHLLASELRPKTLFEVGLMTGKSIGPDGAGLFSIIDSEEKQLQAIEDLYRIVKAQPRYKELKEPNWKTDTDPAQVILWLLRKLGPLAKGEQWTIDTFMKAGRPRFRFVVYKNYYYQHVGNQEEYIPLDFLPALKDRDRPLHDMIIDVVALVSRENKVPLWNEDGDYSEALKDLLEMSRSGSHSIRALQVQAASYSKGPAARYLRHIGQRKKVVTIRLIKQRIQRYDCNSERKRLMIWWVKQGIEVAEKKQCIKANSFVPNYVPGSPVSPWRQYKFVWSLHKNDVLHVRALNKLQKDAKHGGDYFPRMFSIAGPGEILKPLEHDEFPSLLFKFLSYGRKMITGWNREYYYKKAFEAPETPVETLLERIEWDEFVNTVL